MLIITILFYQLLTVLRYYRSKDHIKGIESIFGLSRFLLFLIAIYENINLKKINDLFEETFSSKFQFHLIEPSIANLIINGFIKEKIISGAYIDKIYSLSSIGNEFVLKNSSLILPLRTTKRLCECIELTQ